MKLKLKKKIALIFLKIDNKMRFFFSSQIKKIFKNQTNDETM
jgi:hypothetical protein